jgi:hypothetical protein
VLAGLEPTATGLAEGERPAAPVEGRNDFGEKGYSGLLPPVGDGPHRYFFRVFAAQARRTGTCHGRAPDYRAPSKQHILMLTIPHTARSQLTRSTLAIRLLNPNRRVSSIRNGLIQPKARRRRKAAWRRWERARPMQLWQLDVMGGIWLADGR